MAFMTAEQASALSGSTVRLALLVEMRFASKTARIWNGAGTVDIDGREWDGVGDFGSIDGLQQTREPVSTKVTLRLSGVTAAVLALAKRTRDEVDGRPALIWLQLFTSDWKPLGAKIPVFWGIMQRLNITRTEASGLTGGSRIIEVEVENPFAGRSRPSAGRYTDADQQKDNPGDLFFEFVPRQRSQVIKWPDY